MNKEDLEYRLRELEDELAYHRATGRTQRLVNNTIEKFFQEPMGTPIEIQDHYTGFNIGYDKEHNRGLFDTSHVDDRNVVGAKRANLEMAVIIENRLENEYPAVQYEFDLTNYPFTITRKSETLTERLQREINEIKEKLNND